MIINLIGSLAKLAIFYMIFTTTIHILTKKILNVNIFFEFFQKGYIYQILHKTKLFDCHCE